jgi:hypothetical protein
VPRGEGADAAVGPTGGEEATAFLPSLGGGRWRRLPRLHDVTLAAVEEPEVLAGVGRGAAAVIPGYVWLEEAFDQSDAVESVVDAGAVRAASAVGGVSATVAKEEPVVAAAAAAYVPS